MMNRLSIGERFRALPRPDGRIAKISITTIIAIFVLGLLYYPIGMILVHQIDDDTNLTVQAPSGGSQTVAVTVKLIKRETIENRWTPMDPFFMPSAPLDNMPNFQIGIRDALSRFTIELTDQIGRIRGSSAADKDLELATGYLRYAPDIWDMDLTESVVPRPSSADQYRNAAEALERYNLRLADGNAVFEKRADNLLGTLDRFAADIGSSSAVLDDSITGLSTFSVTADDVFYHTKGRLYGYAMLLRALQADFNNVVAEKQLGALWAQMLSSLEAAASMNPPVVLNGSPDATILPSHLTAQGFYLLRARTQIKEIINVLLK